jgi:predicted DsbA family dithiol-disulfide isomerase
MIQENMKIEIWSDIVCPFCYLGKKKLERAIIKLNLKTYPEIVWHSFQLDPTFPKKTSIPSLQYLSEKKHIPIEQVHGMHKYLADQGNQYGINFQFDKALTFNTSDAHRLWQWSKELNKSKELKEALFSAYFTEGRDLSRHDNLLNVAVNSGLNRDEAEKILNSDSYEQELEEDKYQASQLGIRGVPYFLINEKAVISGAQDDKVFEHVLSAASMPVQIHPLKNKNEK